MIKYKTIEQFAAESGYTPDAIRTKIKRGVWIEGVWIKAPDNRVLISIEEFNLWAINTKPRKGSQLELPKLPKSVSSMRRSGL